MTTIVKDLGTKDIGLVYEARDLLRSGRAHDALILLDTALCIPDPEQRKKYEEWRINAKRSAPPLIPEAA